MFCLEDNDNQTATAADTKVRMPIINNVRSLIECLFDS